MNEILDGSGTLSSLSSKDEYSAKYYIETVTKLVHPEPGMPPVPEVVRTTVRIVSADNRRIPEGTYILRSDDGDEFRVKCIAHAGWQLLSRMPG